MRNEGFKNLKDQVFNVEQINSVFNVGHQINKTMKWGNAKEVKNCCCAWYMMSDDDDDNDDNADDDDDDR